MVFVFEIPLMLLIHITISITQLYHAVNGNVLYKEITAIFNAHIIIIGHNTSQWTRAESQPLSGNSNWQVRIPQIRHIFEIS